MPPTLWPVSYTHLDVYKRQGLGRLLVVAGMVDSPRVRDSFPERIPDHQILSVVDWLSLYLRLSRDDELQGESGSIQTQRMMLRQYAAEHGLTVVDEYIDDGWSGKNFERPSFQRMIAVSYTHLLFE